MRFWKICDRSHSTIYLKFVALRSKGLKYVNVLLAAPIGFSVVCTEWVQVFPTTWTVEVL